MKKFKKVVAGFVIFNCLSLVVLAACADTYVVNGMTCKLNAPWNGYCWYECPNGDVYAKKEKTESEAAIEAEAY